MKEAKIWAQVLSKSWGKFQWKRFPALNKYLGGFGPASSPWLQVPIFVRKIIKEIGVLYRHCNLQMCFWNAGGTGFGKTTFMCEYSIDLMIQGVRQKFHNFYGIFCKIVSLIFSGVLKNFLNVCVKFLRCGHCSAVLKWRTSRFWNGWSFSFRGRCHFGNYCQKMIVHLAACFSVKLKTLEHRICFIFTIRLPWKGRSIHWLIRNNGTQEKDLKQLLLSSRMSIIVNKHLKFWPKRWIKECMCWVNDCGIWNDGFQGRRVSGALSDFGHSVPRTLDSKPGCCLVQLLIYWFISIVVAVICVFYRVGWQFWKHLLQNKLAVLEDVVEIWSTAQNYRELEFTLRPFFGWGWSQFL